MKARSIKNLLIYVICLLPVTLLAQTNSKIISITENFDNDPKWEGVNNRVEGIDCPTITQNFGWAATNKTGFGPGEIGGVIWRSTTPAFYAMPINKPLSFKDPFSASGKIAVIVPPEGGVGFYIGFFNAERQGWRVWSSCGFRMGDMIGGKTRFFIDYKTGTANGANLFPDLEIQGNGSVHTWELKYDPNMSVAQEKWPDERLPKYFEGRIGSVHTDTLLVAIQKDDPSMTKEKLLDLLLKARDAGLVDDWYRKDTYHLWTLEKNPEKIKGKITFTFDGQSVSYYVIPGHQDLPTIMNRFGIYNVQIYTGSLEFYVGDLIVNGKKIDLSQDPHWQGLNNKVTFTETDFHSRHNYGYAQTNWAGEKPGEIGGRFWGTEVKDPLQGFYAADIGEMTLEDPIKFSGKITFTEGAVDGRMLIGYFNKEEKMAPVQGEYKGNPPNQYLGLEVMDQTALGYSFTAVCSPKQNISEELRGPIIIPDRISRQFTFDYDPSSGKSGRITVTLGNDKFSYDLTAEQRKTGSKFNRFGLLSPRKGGKYVDVFFDDLIYSSRLPKEMTVKYKQEVIKEPYPFGGRKYR
ncbi:MAG: hypothetical protein NTX65_03985 [Ignavibacteriales bacterium]|nr:hypothetical protein [Ignavibacteriales bacterium]